MILDYGEYQGARVMTNHNHSWGPRYQESYVKWEGTKGAIKAQLGVNLNYPVGEPDFIEVCTTSHGNNDAWERLPVEGVIPLNQRMLKPITEEEIEAKKVIKKVESVPMK